MKRCIKRTRLGDTNEVPVLETNGDGLALNGTGLLVADLADNVEDGERDLGLVPRAHRMRN